MSLYRTAEALHFLAQGLHTEASLCLCSNAKIQPPKGQGSSV